MVRTYEKRHHKKSDEAIEKQSNEDCKRHPFIYLTFYLINARRHIRIPLIRYLCEWDAGCGGRDGRNIQPSAILFPFVPRPLEILFLKAEYRVTNEGTATFL